MMAVAVGLYSSKSRKSLGQPARTGRCDTWVRPGATKNPTCSIAGSEPQRIRTDTSQARGFSDYAAASPTKGAGKAAFCQAKNIWALPFCCATDRRCIIEERRKAKSL